jgi:hypothetical protein
MHFLTSWLQRLTRYWRNATTGSAGLTSETTDSVPHPLPTFCQRFTDPGIGVFHSCMKSSPSRTASDRSPPLPDFPNAFLACPARKNFPRHPNTFYIDSPDSSVQYRQPCGLFDDPFSPLHDR